MKHSKSLLTKRDSNLNAPNLKSVDDGGGFNIRDIVSTLGKTRSGYWGVEEAKSFFILARKHNGEYEKIAEEMGCPRSRVQLFGQEMKRAARLGYNNLEDYFSKGRPARYGKTQIKIK